MLTSLVTAVAVHPVRKIALTVSRDLTLRSWNLETVIILAVFHPEVYIFRGSRNPAYKLVNKLRVFSGQPPAIITRLDLKGEL